MLKVIESNRFRLSVFGLGVLLIFYGFFIFYINCNSVIYDEIRIVADFFKEYQTADTFIDKIKALFRRENETFPAFIRFIYLLSYWLVGNVRFDVIAYLANIIPIIFVLIAFAKRAFFKVPALFILTLSFAVLNPYSDHIFLFTYASLFYFISILFPIAIVYAYIKNQAVLLIVLMVVLGLSSSTFFIIGLLILAVSLYRREWKTSLWLFATVFTLKLIPILLFGATDDTDKSGIILKSFSHLPELAKLFFITLGSWVQIFNLDVLNSLSIGIGILTFVIVVYTLIVNLKNDFKNPLNNFYAILFVYFWIIFASTTAFRWNFNYDYQLSAIFSPSKSFFVLVYFALTLCYFYYISGNQFFKKSMVILSSVFMLSFFINYFNGINYWKQIYQNTLLAGFNYNTQNEQIDYRNLTFREGYADMVKTGLLTPPTTPFDNAELETLITDSTYVEVPENGLELFKNADINEVNMYDIAIKPVVLYSYNFPFKGNWYSRIDGTYIYLTSDLDKFILPARYVNNTVPNVLIGKTGFNTDWMIATIENSFSLELLKTTYDVYLLEVTNGEFTRMINTKKKLVVTGKNEYAIQVN
jgi:hypothetical protein